MGKKEGENGGKVQGIRSIIGRHRIDREGKNSMGNGEAQELICTTHDMKLSVREGMLWVGGTGQRG